MADQTQPLHLIALGPPEVHLGERPLVLPTRKTLALLFYLALEPGEQPREHLATLLWPEANTERSYASLRNTLGHLQTALRQASGLAQPPYISITHNSLRLNPDAHIILDLNTVEQAYALARADRSSRILPDGSASLPLLQSAAAFQRGDFLDGFSLGDAPGFDDWAVIQREVWHRRLVLVLDRLSEIQFASGEFAASAETASRWMTMDALNEAAYRCKMRAHFAAGERGQALETYEACRAILAAELGIEPEPDTAALADRIRKQAIPIVPLAHRTAIQPLSPDTSVAFLGQLFAGRTREYETLVKCYGYAAAGQPQLVMLRGEAGIGKTRLARKFLAWASTQDAEFLMGRTFESGSHLPFQPLIEALRLRLERKNLPEDLLNEAWLSPLSQLMPELRDRHPELPHPLKARSHQETEVTQTQLFEPFTQITATLAKRAPLVVFMDDLQWADSATLDLLQYLIRRLQESGARVLFLASVRSDALHPKTQPSQAGGPQGLSRWLESVEREITPVHIELEPLGELETVQMILSILLPPAPDFAQWLYDETRGHPFYLKETLKDLLERRVLHPKRHAGGQWTFAVDTEHDLDQAVRIPSTVQAVIRSRLNRLSPNAFSLLAGGAVLEQSITFERLCAISNVTEDLALPALDELISGRLLFETDHTEMTGAYTFTNDMLRDVVYTETGDARRRLFHRRALEILVAAGDSAAVLAHHALAAGLTKATFQHSLVAGRDALRLSAVSEAVVHFEHARQSLQEISPSEMPDKADIRDLYTQLIRAYKSSGQTEKALVIDAEKRDWAFDRENRTVL
jgi:DNA-binding SARP family transcriptional activator